MTAPALGKGFRLWPRTLRSGLFVILLAGLTIAHVMSFTVLFFERYVAAKSVMFNTLENDIATSVAVLDRWLFGLSCGMPLPMHPHTRSGVRAVIVFTIFAGV